MHSNEDLTLAKKKYHQALVATFLAEHPEIVQDALRAADSMEPGVRHQEDVVVDNDTVSTVVTLQWSPALDARKMWGNANADANANARFNGARR